MCNFLLNEPLSESESESEYAVKPSIWVCELGISSYKLWPCVAFTTFDHVRFMIYIMLLLFGTIRWVSLITDLDNKTDILQSILLLHCFLCICIFMHLYDCGCIFCLFLHLVSRGCCHSLKFLLFLFLSSVMLHVVDCSVLSEAH